MASPPTGADAQHPAVVHDDRPWGWFRKYADNEQCTVKIIKVDPGQTLSLQRHRGRDELWVALDDGLIVTRGDDVVTAAAGDEFFVPRGTVHRVAAPDTHAVRFLEVAFGVFDEDDIERLDDAYGRS